MLIFGIESSCDETSCAVAGFGEGAPALLSNAVATQIETHARYGGVVPEIASRDHAEAIMPIARKYSLGEIMPAMDAYYQKTGRRISFEYAMIHGVNDSPQQAELLARRVKPLGAHVNLIPLNHVDERSFQPSTPEDLRRFVDILTNSGVNVTVRRRLGSDVNASCGQLRRSVMRNGQ